MRSQRKKLIGCISDPVPDKLSGVYAILNKEDGRMYIGSSCNLRLRRQLHEHYIRYGKHCCKLLQKEILENPEMFEFSLIELVPEGTERLEREKFWIRFFKTHLPENGYNRSNTGTLLGGRLSEQHKKHISISLKGRKITRSQEWNKKLGASHIGQRNKSQMRSVVQISLDGKRVASFESVADAARHMGNVKRVTNIVCALKGHRDKALGYRWEYGT